MSVFELIMLVCFGAAWPVLIYKSYTSKNNGGQSLLFLFIILVGYLSGIAHKLLYSYDKVIYAYILNFLLVLINIFIYFRNERLASVEVEVKDIASVGNEGEAFNN